MSELDGLENCRDPEEAKKLLAAFFARRLREGTDIGDICRLLAEGIETNRMVFKKRRDRQPGQTHVAADLVDMDWWVEEILKIEEDEP